MIPKFSHKAIIVITSIVAGIVIIILLNVNTTCSQKICFTFPDKQNWVIQEVYEDSAKTFSALFKQPEYMIKVEKIKNTEKNQADEFTKIRTMTLRGLFDTARSPYPGAISDEIACQNKYKPTVKQLASASGLPITYISTFLNNRMQYGACVDDQLAYKGYIAMFYCPHKKEWYQTELIVPIGNDKPENYYTELYENIVCL